MLLVAACHVHSDWSYDGKYSLERLGRDFAARGYRVLLMAEHDRGFSPERFTRYRDACLRASSEEVLIVPGLEYSDPTNSIHVLVWGTVPFLGESLSTTALLEAVRTNNGLAVLAHPSRRDAWKAYDETWSQNLLGVEVWNRKCDGWAPSTAARRILRSDGPRPFVGLDFHDRRHFFPLTMQIDADLPDEPSVLAALRRGQFQALAFGRPVGAAMQGWIGSTLATAEQLRRKAAVLYRRMRVR